MFSVVLFSYQHSILEKVSCSEICHSSVRGSARIYFFAMQNVLPTSHINYILTGKDLQNFGELLAM